jgi:hypothetical protein
MNSTSTLAASGASSAHDSGSTGATASVAADAAVVVKPPRTRRTPRTKTASHVAAPTVLATSPQSFMGAQPVGEPAPQDQALSAGKAFSKGAASMGSQRVKAQVQEQLGSARALAQRTQSGVVRVAQGIKNTSIGALLVFMANLPQFFEPVLFVMANSKMLGKAALHVFAPLALAWYAAQLSPVLRDSLFSSPNMGMKMLGSVSLYALSSFTWMMGWLFTSSVFRGIGSQLSAFEKVGEQQSV